MKTIMSIISSIISGILAAAVVVAIAASAFLYMHGFGISAKDGIYKDYTSAYGYVTYRYGNLTFDDIMMFEEIGDSTLSLAVYGYFPSSTEIRG